MNCHKFSKFGVLLLSIFLTAVATAGVLTQSTGGLLFVSTEVSSDTTPDAFSFTDQTGVTVSSTITSAAVTITGIDASITCSATGGTIDKNSGGSFASSQSIANNDTIRAQHTSSASNSTAVDTVVDCGGVSDTFTSTTAAEAGAGVFFNPDVDSATSILDIFDDQNNQPFATLDTTVVRPSHTKSLRLTYTADEDGTDLIVQGESIGGQFVATSSLFVRSYERFEGPWEGNWPQGLKTARYFTTPNLVGCQDAPNDYAYLSEKIIYPGYETDPDPRLEDYVTAGSWSYCNREEIGSTYGPDDTFGNSLPYLRTGHWYKWERWMVLNSSDEAADGILQIWIDDVLVLDLSNVVYISSSSGAGKGTQWMGMWFGGNLSNTGTFNAPSTLYRYISDPYLSTTKDR